MFLRRFPQYPTIASLALSLLLFLHSFFLLPFFTDSANASYSAKFADFAAFHLIGMICSFVGNDKTRLNTVVSTVWAIAFLAMKTPAKRAVVQTMISMPQTNGLNTDLRPDLHNSLLMVILSSTGFEIRCKVDMDEMRNAELHTPTLKSDDPTKTSMPHVIPTHPTPNGSFTSAMSSSLQLAPTPSLLEPSQVQTKPPTVKLASSPIPVTLSVKNQNIPANSRTTSVLVSVSDQSGVLTQPINPTTSRPPTSGYYLQSKILNEQLSRKVPKYTTPSQVQEAIKYLSVKELRKNRDGTCSHPSPMADMLTFQKESGELEIVDFIQQHRIENDGDETDGETKQQINLIGEGERYESGFQENMSLEEVSEFEDSCQTDISPTSKAKGVPSASERDTRTTSQDSEEQHNQHRL
ncbi:hypothetical protein BLNAU_22949 [Blattamonas nauphoetae]|uniref:Uncharacterized protein n=1 Tax=Blattamonas nauphoetae TaxID=2049346 RepID=A0ABQ9WRM4_9EUKA|nr:hypothetical protein BLNAU_22949 [Blattamonas nauphoetae]